MRHASYRHFFSVYYSRRMATLINEATEKLACRIRLERVCAAGRSPTWRNVPACRGHDQQDRARGSKPDGGDPRAAGERLRPDAGRVALRAESHGGQLSRAADQPLWRDPGTGYLRRQVFSRPDHPLEIIRVGLPARRRVALPGLLLRTHPPGRAGSQTGNLVIIEGGERHLLGPGDCLGFGPPSEVTIANETAAPCSYLVVLARG